MAFQGSAVESANVVGYQTVTLPAQTYAMIGVPFTAAGSSAGISVQDLVATNGLKAAQLATNADKLWYYDPNEAGGYVKLHLFDSTSTAAAAQAMKGKWVTSAKPTDTSWGSGINKVSEKILTPGMGLWLVRADASEPLTLTFSGQVVVAPEGNEVALREGYNMIAGSFSSDFVFNNVAAGVSETDVDWKSLGCVAAQLASNADSIWFYDEGEAGGYAKVHLFDSTSTASAALAMKNHWVTSAKPTDTTWGSGINKVTPKKIPAGRGFWYIRQDSAHGGGATTIKFPQPYSL